MKSGEVNSAILVDFSKAIDILILKFHSLHFSKNFLNFVKTDSHCSHLLYSKFDIQQGSIEGPVLFNICITDMTNCVPSCICLQYTGNSTLYQNCKAKDRKSCADILTRELSNMLIWSSNNLAFKATKTKSMLFTTSQLESSTVLDRM